MKNILTPMMTAAMALLVLGAGNAVAQTAPSKDVDTVASGIGEENLAPLPVKKTVVSSTIVAVSASGVGVAVSDTAASDPFVVKGVVVTLSGTAGFDRDAALEQAARQALPGVLTTLAIPAAKAAKTVKGIGSAMQFVKSYKVVKESLIPVYTLTTDLTFNGAMLHKNFGGTMPVAKVVAVSGTVADVGSVSDTDAAVPAVENKPLKQWVVRITERDPAAVDKVRVNLNRQAGTQATYRLLTAAGAELLVETPLDAAQVSAAAGHEVDVAALDVPLPTAVVPVNGAPRQWQGQGEPNTPAEPDVPSVPGVPQTPAGNY